MKTKKEIEVKLKEFRVLGREIDMLINLKAQNIHPKTVAFHWVYTTNLDSAFNMDLDHWINKSESTFDLERCLMWVLDETKFI